MKVPASHVTPSRLGIHFFARKPVFRPESQRLQFNRRQLPLQNNEYLQHGNSFGGIVSSIGLLPNIIGAESPHTPNHANFSKLLSYPAYPPLSSVWIRAYRRRLVFTERRDKFFQVRAGQAGERSHCKSLLKRQSIIVPRFLIFPLCAVIPAESPVLSL